MSDKLMSQVDQFHSTGMHLATSTVRLFGEITHAKAEQFITNMYMLNLINRDITILLNSEGGSVEEGRGIYDIIKRSRNYVKIIVINEASSIASCILQAADYRIMLPSSCLMVHVGAESHEEDHPKNVAAASAYYAKLGEWMKEIYLERIKVNKPKYNKRHLRDLLTFDSYLDPSRALELGLIDKVEER